MVGMSGKVSEPRRGQASQQKKAGVVSGGPVKSNKSQPPAEALHVANILGDKYPADVGKKITEVLGCLPSCSEEEVWIALHDHDFDTGKAITALLDGDTETSAQGEWTTKKKGRRSKGEGTTDLIIAPGDSRSAGRQGSGRGTNRAASQNVRENFGGSVNVGGEGSRGRGGKGRSSSSGRGRSTSGRREKEGKEEEKSGPRGERGSARIRNRGPRTRNRPRQTASEQERPVEEGRMDDKTLHNPIQTEAWEEVDPQPSTEWEDHQLHQTGSPPHHPNSIDPAAVDHTWDSEAESKGSQPLFPEAIPFTEPSPVVAANTLPLVGLPTASCAQPTPHTATAPALPRQPTPGSSSYHPGPVEFQTTVSLPAGMATDHSSRHRSRHKRLARSQIPSQPVEMPKGTYPEMSELGIAFGGMDIQPPSSSELPQEPTVTTKEALLTTPPTNEVRYSSDPVTSAATYSTQFPEDAGVISITTSSSYSGGSGKKLEAPPGLPHPMVATLPHTITASGTLPHTSTAPPLPHSVVPSGALPHSVVPSGSLPHSVVPSGTLPHSVIPSGTLPHSAVPSGSLPHSVVPSGTLPHSVITSGNSSLPHSAITDTGLSTTSSIPHTTSGSNSQEPVASSIGRGQIPKNADTTVPHSQGSSSNGGVGQLLPPDPISLPPPSSLLPSIDLPSVSDHSKATTSTSQLLSQSFSTVTSSSSAAAGSGTADLIATPTSSSMTTPTSKASQSSSYHHTSQQQAQLQGAKHGSIQQQQQQQQAMIYPYMPPLMMPMSAYYDPNEMSRYQASVSMAYYQHPTSSDPAMATGMGRDHGASGFVSEGGAGAAGGGKFGRGADISTSTTPSNPPHSQQQGGVQQGQMSHAAVFNPYYGGNIIYPMYHGYGMPGFSAHSLPKPSGGSSYPAGGVNSYQAPSGAGFGYEDVASGAQDYKMYGGMQTGLGKPNTMTSSTGEMPSAGSYKHQGFDTGKTASSYSAYGVPQGGYGFIPTGPMPLQMPPNYIPGHEGGGGRSQKHSKNYGSSQLWSQPGH